MRQVRSCDHRLCRTFTLEALPHQTPQHLATVVAEGWCLVGVNIEHVGTDLEVLHRGLS